MHRFMESATKFRCVVLLLISQLIYWTQLSAQEAVPLFKHFTTDDGLPTSEMYSVLADKNGNMWFGTDRGVVRYDGYEFKTFTTQDGLTDNTVFYLFLDTNGKLWMYTFSGRIFYFENEKILPYKYNQQLLLNSQNRIPNGFYIDSLEDVTVALRDQGTFTINNNGKFNRLDSVSLQPDSHYFINEFPGGKSTISMIVAKKKYENVFVNYRFGNFKKTYQIEATESGRLTFQRLSSTEFIFSLGFSVFYFKDEKIEKLFTLPRIIFSILKDDQENLWVGTEDGVYYYDKKDWRNHSKIFLNQNMITSIFQDQENGYWFTTLENGVFYLPDYEIKNIPLTGIIQKPISLATDFKSKIYIGCWNGTIAELSNGKVKAIFELSNTLKKLPITDLSSFPNDKKIYVSRYFPGKIENGEFQLFKSRYSFGVKTEYFKRANGNIYGAGSSFILEVKGDSIVCPDILSQRINSVLETEDGKLLIGYNRGVFYFDEATKKETPYRKEFDELRVDDIKKLNGKLFFGTKGKGLMMVSGDSVFTIDESMGLASNLVGKITVSGNELWIATNKGISHLVFSNTSTNEFTITNIYHSDGLLNDEVSEVVVLNDTVYVATSSGISIFRANADFKNTTRPRIYISSLEVNTNKIQFAESLNLRHDSNNIHVSFNAISFKSFGKLIYRYQLIHSKDTISSTTSNKEVEFLALAPGSYHFNVMAMNKSGVWSNESARFDFVIRPAWWQTIWFKGVLAFFITCLIYVYYRSQIERLRNKMENEQIQASLQLTAIRAQMNPHFIFNVMNSIRIYMQNHDTKSAEKYLTSFSKLVRYVLDNSDKQVVSLEDELNALRNYVELERERFENGFEFKIDCDPEIDLSDYQLPSLLLQPFVENSIKHGISRLQSGGKIHVEISKNGTNLLISIEDNGVGLKNSEKWNNQDPEYHSSKGTEIIFQRIEAYNKCFGKKIKAEIRDLPDENGKSTGTRVEVEI